MARGGVWAWRAVRGPVAAGAGAALLALAAAQVAATKGGAARAPEPTRIVWVAREPVPAGAVIAPGAVAAEPWPAGLVPPDAVSADPAGRAAAMPLEPGWPVVAAALAPASADPLAAALPPGTVGIALAGPPAQMVDGAVRPGDHVTVFEVGAQGAVPVLRRAPVVAVNGSATGAPTPGQAETLILALPPGQAARLAAALLRGGLVVALDR